MKVLSSFLTLCVLWGCSTGPTLNEKRAPLQFSAIERLEIGKAFAKDLRMLVGEPDRKIALKREFSEFEYWGYSDADQFERFGALVERKSGIIQTCTWNIREGELLSQKQETLKHFTGSNFVTKPVGKVAPDYYSADMVYSDFQKGISFLVEERTQGVVSISFETPPQRKIAKKEN